LHPYVAWGDSLDGAPPALSSFNKTALASQGGTGEVTLLTGVNSHSLKPKLVSLFNAHASASSVVYLNFTDGTNVEEIAGSKVTLLAGESLVYIDGQGCMHYDAEGHPYPSVGNRASQAEMEAGTSDDKYVTPLKLNFHPGAIKCWGKANGAGTSLLANWNVSGITDTGTGRLGVTIGADFSSVNYSITPGIERVSTSLAVASVDIGGVLRNASQAAGSFEIENFDETATTNVAQDPANYHWQCAGDQA
jgi:hypothetical protein